MKKTKAYFPMKRLAKMKEKFLGLIIAMFVPLEKNFEKYYTPQYIILIYKYIDKICLLPT